MARVWALITSGLRFMHQRPGLRSRLRSEMTLLTGTPALFSIRSLIDVTQRVTVTPMVLRIRHLDLRKLSIDGGTWGVNANHVAKLRLILAALDAAEAPADMDVAGWRLHPLKGARKGYWSVWVSGNWRVTFRIQGNDTTDVDYEDYH